MLLKALEEVVYFEAYDNYSYLWDESNAKHLCDYSLGYLDGILGPNFVRIHRKYIVNKDKIESVSRHIKDRYSIRLIDTRKTVLTSSSTYAESIRSLIRI